MRSPEGRVHDRKLFGRGRHDQARGCGSRCRCHCSNTTNRPNWRRSRSRSSQGCWCDTGSPTGRTNTTANPSSIGSRRRSPFLATITHSYMSPWFSIVTRRRHGPRSLIPVIAAGDGHIVTDPAGHQPFPPWTFLPNPCDPGPLVADRIHTVSTKFLSSYSRIPCEIPLRTPATIGAGLAAYGQAPKNSPPWPAGHPNSRLFLHVTFL